jgi:hypothetical protein
MQPVRGSKGRSVRQNRNGSNSGAGNNGHSGNRIVTHPEKGTGQHFLNIRRKAVVREGKPVRITVAWLCTTSRLCREGHGTRAKPVKTFQNAGDPAKTEPLAYERKAT